MVSASSVAPRVEFEALISDISARLLEAPPEAIDGVIQTALDEVRAFFGADRALLVTVRPDYAGVVVRFVAASEGVTGADQSTPLAEMFPWCARRLMQERAPIIIPRVADMPTEAAVDRAAFEGLGTRSNLTVPLFVRSVPDHVIAVGWVRQECDVPLEYAGRVRLLGEMFVNALERRQMFAKLRQGEERLERAAASAHCGLWELEAATGVIWGTDETRRIHGVDAHEVLTYELFVGLLHGDDRARVMAAVRRAFETGAEYEQEYRIVRPDGVTRWIHAAGRPEGGRLLGTSIDVTERRQQEEDLRRALDEVHRLRQQLQNENVYLREQSRRTAGPDEVVGHSAAIRRALTLAEQVAVTNATVLLTGETGTGKERFATLIHAASPRAARTMVRVNCSAIPTALIESELFGREKGAYTGALSRQIGRFEVADGSTLFLDEVSDLPLDVQVKLLRVLQERTIERLGSPRPIPVDVRIIAATNRDLEQAVREGRFRSDLYYRLNVFPVHVPPLRERIEDIPSLVSALVDEIGAAMGKRFESVSKTSVEALQRYTWPGNVRELRNVLERAMILATGPVLRVDAPSAPGPAASAGPAAPSGRLEDVEREHIISVLRSAGWRIKGPGAASVLLGMKPSTLYWRMKKLGITKPDRG